jgi:hypothetical protein
MRQLWVVDPRCGHSSRIVVAALAAANAGLCVQAFGTNASTISAL